MNYKLTGWRKLGVQYVVCIFSALLLALPVQANLKDFEKNTKKEEKQKSASSSPAEDSVASALFAAIAGVFATIWYDWNNAVHYDTYPYARDRAFIERNPPELPDNAPERANQYRTYWQAEAAGQFQEGATRAASLSLAGRFTPVFGAFVRYRQFFEGGVQSLHDTRLGFDVALLQFSSMQLGVQLAYANFSGLLERSGFSPSLDATFFPGKPVLLGLSVGTVQFPQITYLEVRPRIGFLLNRWELFVAGYLLSAETAYLRGIETGARVWF
mgnify:CR=1 FL=1